METIQGFNITDPMIDRESYQLWYDNNSHFSNQQVTKDYPFMYWLLPFVKGTVIELGCQWGGITQILCDHPQTVSVDAIDITDQHIAKTKDYVQSPKLGRIWKSYIEDLDTDKKYDTVFATNVLEHVLNSVETLTNTLELIAPGGQMLLAVPNGPSFPEPDHIREYDFRSLYKEIKVASMETGITINIQICATYSPEFDIEHYSWLLAKVTRNQ